MKFWWVLLAILAISFPCLSSFYNDQVNCDALGEEDCAGICMFAHTPQELLMAHPELGPGRCFAALTDAYCGEFIEEIECVDQAQVLIGRTCEWVEEEQAAPYCRLLMLDPL